LVEDVPDIRELSRAMLEQLGHQVFEAGNGKEGIQAAIAHHPDCILIDLSMPEVDGLLTTAALRTISPLRNVPIVAITAFSKDLSREMALAAGCDAYLEKPFTLEELAAVLQKFPAGVVTKSASETTAQFQMNPVKWRQFVEEVRTRWNLDLRDAATLNEIKVLLHRHIGLSVNRAEREMQEMIRDFQDRVRLAD
jgi:CheY-like chemotaxis protein